MNKDIIYRQEAISLFDREHAGKYWGRINNDILHEIWRDLKSLPSAQPEKRTEERTETHACDCISRQTAIDSLGEEPEVWTEKDEYAQGLNNQWHYDVNAIKALPSAQPNVPDINDGDMISRQAAIESVEHIASSMSVCVNLDECHGMKRMQRQAVIELTNLPSVQPTLYGYKIEHLAYIARVMEKEGVTADYAVRTFDDMSRVIKMIIDEIQQKVEETLNG